MWRAGGTCCPRRVLMCLGNACMTAGRMGRAFLRGILRRRCGVFAGKRLGTSLMGLMAGFALRAREWGGLSC